MKKESQKIHFQIFKHVVDHCGLLNIDRNKMLRFAGVDNDFLKKGVSYVSMDVFEKLFIYIYENLDDEHNILNLFAQRDALSVGPLELLMSLSENLDDAISSYYKYREINGDLEKFTVFFVEDDEATLKWNCSPKENYLLRSVVDCQTAWWGNFIRLIDDGGKIYIKKVCYEHEQNGFSKIKIYQKYFGCPVYFDQNISMLVFSKNALKIPFKTANKELYLIVENYIKGVLVSHRNEGKIKDRVKTLIYLKLKKGIVSREVIAEKLGITVRTLTRKLYAEGSSYGELLEEVRLEIAYDYLKNSDCSILDLSKELGFLKSSAFITWFKAIHNITPKKFRDNYIGNR